MIKVSFHKTHLSEFSLEEPETLMSALLRNNIPVASSCHGDGVCGKCRIFVESGMENLSALNATEEFLKEKLNLEQNERISCQSIVFGDVKVDAKYW